MTQALTDWTGDVGSLLSEMKRRAGVRTDQQLADFMGAAQSTVSNWRKRGEVPEAAILQFEAVASNPRGDDLERLTAAQTIALRVPELYYQRMRDRNSKLGRDLIYSYVSLSFGAITNEIGVQLESLERESGLTIKELRAKLVDDEGFLQGFLDWLEATSLADLVASAAAFAERKRHL
jgi:hypothetical protein